MLDGKGGGLRVDRESLLDRAASLSFLPPAPLGLSVREHGHLVGEVFLPLQLVHGGDDVGHLLQVDTTAVVHIVHPAGTWEQSEEQTATFTTEKLSK